MVTRDGTLVIEIGCLASKALQESVPPSGAFAYQGEHDNKTIKWGRVGQPTD